MTALSLVEPGVAPPNAFAFWAENNRLPHLGDPAAPWEHRGWLLPYAQVGHAVIPDCAERWPWWLAAVHNRELPGPIPKVHFGTSVRSPSTKSLEACLRKIEGRWGSWESFRLFCEWLGWGLSVHNEAPKFEPELNEALYRTFDLKPWLRSPGDHLGDFIAEQRSGGWNPHAFYPTPHELIEAMVQITIVGSGHEDDPFATFNEPCCGTGRIFLHASNYSLCMCGQDVDRLVVLIARINAALYVPWLAFPPSAEMLEEMQAKWRLRQRVEKIKALLCADGFGALPAEAEGGVELAAEAVEPEAVSEPALPFGITWDSRGQGSLF